MWCKSYSACLDAAIRQEWPGFSCDRCELRDQVSRQDPDPPFAIKALVFAVLHPVPWAYYVARLEALLKRDTGP